MSRPSSAPGSGTAVPKPAAAGWEGADAPPRVLVHVGLPKTGTSFLQRVLLDHRETLARHGIRQPDLPGQGLFLAVLYLTGRSASWGRSAKAGQRAWQRILKQVDGPGTFVVSSETLCLASHEQVKRVLEDLGDHEVHLMVTVRDPARQLPAEWQEGVKHGRPGSYESFLDAVLLAPGLGSPARARARHRRFWAGQDPVDVLDRWAADLPAGRVHVVTCPPPTAPRRLLWDRVATVLGCPAEAVDPEAGAVNVSLGRVQVEVLRRVNRRFRRRGREQSYGDVAKRLYAGRILRAQGGERVVLPPDRAESAARLARRWTEQLAASGYHVVGDLDDLLVDTHRAPASGQGRVTSRAMLRASLDATGELLAEIERLRAENADLRRDATRAAAGPLSRRRRALAPRTAGSTDAPAATDLGGTRRRFGSRRRHEGPVA